MKILPTDFGYHVAIYQSVACYGRTAYEAMVKVLATIERPL